MTALAHHRRESVCQSESDGFMEEGKMNRSQWGALTPSSFQDEISFLVSPILRWNQSEVGQ